MNVCGNDISIHRSLVRVGRVAAEGFEYLRDPEAAVASLRGSNAPIDLFTFFMPLPRTSPEFPYPVEWDNLAALPITTFEHWWTQQIDGKTRNMVRRAEKKGLIVREVPFDGAFANGIWRIYNESPIRQGRRFPHYGKTIEAVHDMSATFLDNSRFIGAYLDGELIGFAKITWDHSKSQAAIMHILGMLEHRDKAPTNALLAHAVQTCAGLGIPYLVYSRYAFGNKQRDSLSAFKDSNGFRRFDIPRYYVPLSRWGSLGFRLGLHRSFLEYAPEAVLAEVRRVRGIWYNWKYRRAYSEKPPLG